MNTYCITPINPLVFRSGRPFGQGGDAYGLDLPLPSTMAGAVRSLWGEQTGIDFIDLNEQNEQRLMQIAVQGPLFLVQDHLSPHQKKLLWPKPADAVYLKEKGQIELHQLIPGRIKMPANSGCDLPKGLESVYLDTDNKGKPASGAKWWSEKHFFDWLSGKKPAWAELNESAWSGPHHEMRTHVKLNAETEANEEGLLYQTDGRSYRDQNHTYQLSFRCSDQLQSPDLIRLGGEGRLSKLESSDPWSSCSSPLQKSLDDSRHIRLILLTPALFKEGWRPGWLNNELEGQVPNSSLRLKLKAVKLERWQALSGWDLKSQKPRAVRRMVPAGSVYWFEVLEGQPSSIWLHSISDEEQDRRDGFGLAVPGLWRK